MSKNILQVYQTNPIAVNQGTDLMYFGRSPYGTGDDTAMQFSDFAAQFAAPYTPSALTRIDDTNVTVTLGGTPGTALLESVSLTMGWSGQLSPARGGTGIDNGVNTITLGGSLETIGAFNSVFTMTGATNVTFPTSGTLATVSQIPSVTPSALTRTDDTNVTLTLGGTPSTALLEAVSLTLGWTGELSVPRGGTGNNTFTAYSVICAGTTATGALQNVSGTGTTGQLLTSNGASALPTWEDAPSGGLPWTNVTGTTQAMSPNNGYIANNAGLVTLTLPLTAAVGTMIMVQGNGAGGWSIAQNSGQNIQIGSSSSTSGAGGSISSTNRYDSLQLVCTVADTTWCCIGGPQSAGITIN